jgi:AcrR family transcriptional regulator
VAGPTKRAPSSGAGAGAGTGSTPGDASREEILRAAAELFMAAGYAATSIDAVARRLGATKGRIYHHYRSKSDLYLEVQLAAMRRLDDTVGAIARGPGRPEERLAAMALRHVRILLTELPMQKVAVQGLGRRLADTPSSARRLRLVLRMRDDYERLFGEVIDQGVRSGAFVDLPPRLATKPFFGALNWTTVWYGQRRLQHPEAVDDIAHALADFAMRGILKDIQHEPASQPTLLRDPLG